MYAIRSYYVPVLLAGFLPWIAFLRRVAVSSRGVRGTFLPREDLVFLVSWASFIVVFFSFSYNFV